MILYGLTRSFAMTQRPLPRHVSTSLRVSYVYPCPGSRLGIPYSMYRRPTFRMYVNESFDSTPDPRYAMLLVLFLLNEKKKKIIHPSIPVMCVKEDTCWRQPLCYYCFCSQVMLQFFTCDRSLSQLSVGPVVLCGRCSYLKGSI